MKHTITARSICLLSALLLLAGCGEQGAPAQSQQPQQPQQLSPAEEAALYLPTLEGKMSEISGMTTQAMSIYPNAAAGCLCDLDGDGNRELMLIYPEEQDGAETLQLEVYAAAGEQAQKILKPVSVKEIHATLEEYELRGTSGGVDIVSKDGALYVRVERGLSGQDFFPEMYEDTGWLPENHVMLGTHMEQFYFQMVDGELVQVTTASEHFVLVSEHGTDPFDGEIHEPTASFLVNGEEVDKEAYDAFADSFEVVQSVASYFDDPSDDDPTGEALPLQDLIDELRALC